LTFDNIGSIFLVRHFVNGGSYESPSPFKHRCDGVHSCSHCHASTGWIDGARAVQRTSNADHARSHHHYQLIDLGTFGGPNSSLPGSNESLNPSGAVTGAADTSFLDPDFAIQNPYFSDPYIERSYIWNDGHRTPLPALRGGRNAGPQWINESASIVGASENGQIDPLTGIKEIHAVLWDPERRIHDLRTLGGNGSVAWVINNAGQVAGDSLNDIPDDLNASGALGGLPGATQQHSFLWQNGVMHDLGTLGGTLSGTYAINERGQVVGLSTINSIPNPGTGIPTIDPFFWDGHKMIDIGSLGGTFGVAGAINNRGQVTGYSNRAGDDFHHAFLWPGRDGKIVDLGTLGGSGSEAKAINDSGYVTGAARLPGNTVVHAVLWGNGGILDLGVIPGDLCDEGMSLNSRLQVVGYSNQVACHGPHAHGFLWEHGVLFDLNRLIVNRSALQVIEGVFINERGEIIGNAVTPEGNNHAVVLIPCDEFHPNRDGCDYRDVDESEAALSGVAGPTPSSGSSALHDRHMASKKIALLRPA
jgi:probable HAF family extracellular repeat protein